MIGKRPGVGAKKLGDKGGMQLIPDSPASRADPDIQFTEGGYELIITLTQDRSIQIRKKTVDEVKSIFDEIEAILDSKSIRT